MFRCLFMTFYGRERFNDHTREHLHESPRNMTIPLQILAFGAVFAGLFGVPRVLQVGPLKVFDRINLEKFLEPSIYTIPHGAAAGVAHHPGAALELGLMALSVGVALVGIFIAYLMYIRKPEWPGRVTSALGTLYTLVYRKYFVDEIYDALIVRPLLAFAEFSAWFDRAIIDGAVNGAAALTRGISTGSARFDALVVDGMVNGTASGVGRVGLTLRRVHAGAVQSYVLGAVVMALCVLMVYFMLF